MTSKCTLGRSVFIGAVPGGELVDEKENCRVCGLNEAYHDMPEDMES